MTQENQSYSYLWKIANFSEQLQLAKQQDRDIILYSEPFYSHKNGYKLKLELCPNGNGRGKGTHVSVFMVIMKGEYDAVLTWPFNWKNRFTLIDQKPRNRDRKNIVWGFDEPDLVNDIECYQRPTTEINEEIGSPKFVSHKKLQTEKYVVDGAIFIKFEIKKS